MDTHVGNQFDEVVQLVSFRLGDEEFAVDILKVQEINRMVEITRLPDAPHYCEGVINLRGTVIPVLNLRKKFDMDGKEWDKNTRIIVCVVEGSVVGMVVDAVEEVLRLRRSTIEPAPDIVTSCNTDYINGVAKLDKRLLIFLDISRIAVEAHKAVKSETQCYEPQPNMKAENSTSTSLTLASGAGLERRTMMNSIEMIVTKLKDVTRELNENTGELVSAANEIVSCAQATVKAAEHMSELTGKQAQCAGQVSTTVEETTVAFTEVWRTSGDNTRKLAEMIKTIQTETENARQSMEAGIQVVYKGREMADKANSSLNEAVDMSKEAMGVIEQITPSFGQAAGTKKRVEQTVTI
ncbi:MAG: chemotaxis protein CheW [candidate division Zixibacteria bacterium]